MNRDVRRRSSPGMGCSCSLGTPAITCRTATWQVPRMSMHGWAPERLGAWGRWSLLSNGCGARPGGSEAAVGWYLGGQLVNVRSMLLRKVLLQQAPHACPARHQGLPGWSYADGQRRDQSEAGHDHAAHGQLRRRPKRVGRQASTAMRQGCVCATERRTGCRSPLNTQQHECAPIAAAARVTGGVGEVARDPDRDV
jgi:hypothetical protein